MNRIKLKNDINIKELEKYGFQITGLKKHNIASICYRLGDTYHLISILNFNDELYPGWIYEEDSGWDKYGFSKRQTNIERIQEVYDGLIGEEVMTLIYDLTEAGFIERF